MRLRRHFDPGRWRKLKGTARVRLGNGTLRQAEVHWYEAHGIGRKKMKIKRCLDRGKGHAAQTGSSKIRSVREER
jgi:hypothetical protein